jgi:hypothetical protein
VDRNHGSLDLPGTLRIHRPRNIRVARRIRARDLGLNRRLRSGLLRAHRILWNRRLGVRNLGRVGRRVDSGLVGRPMKYFV